MSKSDSNSQESTARFADHITLGTDNEGRVHHADLRAGKIHVIGVDADRFVRRIPDGRSLDDYMALVDAEGTGWAERQYGRGLFATAQRTRSLQP